VQSTSTEAADLIKTPSRIQRFNMAFVTLKDLASFVADQPRAKFENFMKAIDLFTNVVTTGDISALVETLQNINNDTSPAMEEISTDEMNSNFQVASRSTSDISPTALQLPIDIQYSVENHSSQLVEEVLMSPASTRDVPLSSTENMLSSTSSSAKQQCDKVRFQPVAKSRGRPPEIRVRPFKVRGRRTTKASEVTALQGLINDEEMQIDSDLCYVCMREEPPMKLSSSKLIDWFECTGSCGRWFHDVCMKRRSQDVSSPAVCSNCIIN
jgi:hypothetical protein